jgi:2-polyprenyl-3-methyl-5-hydroxy-6-metoxy-1,4-benzoquinol methylase/uncharacterized membrane protein YbhN (UPF0104 family)
VAIVTATASTDLAAGARTPPRAVAWLLLSASGAAVLAAGLVGTALILVRAGATPPIPVRFWGWFAVACGLTVASLGLRALRWVFLLRRAGVRIPIRDAYIGYFSGLSLLLVPFLVGEILVRAFVQRARSRVPLAATCVVNVWERWLDLVALAAVAVLAAPSAWSATAWGLAVPIAIAGFVRPIRDAALTVVVWLGHMGARRVAGPGGRAGADGQVARADVARLTEHRAWLTALVVSLAAWALPALGLWGLASSWHAGFTLRAAEAAYASSALAGGLVLAPGGILMVGGRLLAALTAGGMGEPAAVVTVIAIRLATAGVAVALGAVFVGIHLRTRGRPAGAHFDAIASAYDVQIPEARRLQLLTRKTTMMAHALTGRTIGRRGLDVGCGQGWYVARMRELGFDVAGIDDSAGQVELARRHAGEASIEQGSALAVPASDAAFDFVYVINVLHHLGSIDEQRAAFAELLRVLRPGGLLFVHEINTRNVLFRFHMGYVFPSLNCIDEGHERWLLPHRLDTFTAAPVVHTEYFTFLPEFLPAFFVRALGPFERLLEASPLRVYSAHYMAVVQKP